MYSPLDLLAMDQKEGTEQKRMSPPKAFVDSSPLQSAMEKNRECRLKMQKKKKL